MMCNIAHASVFNASASELSKNSGFGYVSITTDGKTGALSPSDITAFSIDYDRVDYIWNTSGCYGGYCFGGVSTANTYSSLPALVVQDNTLYLQNSLTQNYYGYEYSIGTSTYMFADNGGIDLWTAFPTWAGTTVTLAGLSGTYLALANGPVSTVPIPSSWLLFITGFGLLGLAALRKRGTKADSSRNQALP